MPKTKCSITKSAIIKNPNYTRKKNAQPYNLPIIKTPTSQIVKTLQFWTFRFLAF